MAAMADALSTLGASFITFFSIVNPIGSALIFDRAVADLSRSARRRLAQHIALLSGVIVVVRPWRDRTSCMCWAFGSTRSGWQGALSSARRRGG